MRKARSSRDVGLPDGVDDDGYMAALTRHLPEVFADFAAPDFVLYRGRCRPHHRDKLGRLALTDAGLELRDRFVVAEARRRGLAIASALGGDMATMPAVAARHAASMLAMADENVRSAWPT